MNKPLLKDAWRYFNDSNNWWILHSCEETGLIISKLAHVPVVRISLLNHYINEYVQYVIHPLLYFTDCRGLDDIHQNPAQTSLSERNIKDLIKYKWEEAK